MPLEGDRSEKDIIREHITEAVYTHLNGTAYYTPRLYGTAPCSWATSLYSRLLYKTRLNQAQEKWRDQEAR